MLSVSIVLIAIVGTINIANYISTNQALDARLSLIADNGGTFPDMTPGDFGKKLEPKSDQPPAMNDLQKHGISQESPFDTRYFTVTIAPDGTVEYVDTGKIASISAGTAEEYAAELWKKGKKKGKSPNKHKHHIVAKKERNQAFSLIINTLQRTVPARRCMYF